jgi:hypothetical protein
MLFPVAFGIGYLNFAKENESSQTGETRHKEISSKQDKAQEGIDKANVTLEEVLRQVTKSKEGDLKRKYPYGFVIIGSREGNTDHIEHEGEFANDIKADWKNATVTRIGPRLLVSIPELQWFRPEVDIGPTAGVMLNQQLAFGEGTIQPVHPITEGSINAYIEVLSADSMNPVVALGFK